MIRWVLATAALCTTIGCAGGPAELAPRSSSPEEFVGAWHSVTPSFEFIRLTVNSKSSQMGVLGARLTLSGAAWEGSGRIDGDSLVFADMPAGAMPSRGLVVHALDARTLRLQGRPATAGALDLTLVRED
jgi:hypothetical protein